jgi:hypothetical protein
MDRRNQLCSLPTGWAGHSERRHRLRSHLRLAQWKAARPPPASAGNAHCWKLAHVAGFSRRLALREELALARAPERRDRRQQRRAPARRARRPAAALGLARASRRGPARVRQRVRLPRARAGAGGARRRRVCRGAGPCNGPRPRPLRVPRPPRGAQRARRRHAALPAHTHLTPQQADAVMRMLVEKGRIRLEQHVCRWACGVCQHAFAALSSGHLGGSSAVTRTLGKGRIKLVQHVCSWVCGGCQACMRSWVSGLLGGNG